MDFRPQTTDHRPQTTDPGLRTPIFHLFHSSNSNAAPSTMDFRQTTQDSSPRIPQSSVGTMQLKPVGRAVPSPPFRDFLSIFANGTGSQFSVWLTCTVALVNLPQRRGWDTAPYPTKRHPTTSFRLRTPNFHLPIPIFQLQRRTLTAPPCPPTLVPQPPPTDF